MKLIRIGALVAVAGLTLGLTHMSASQADTQVTTQATPLSQIKPRAEIFHPDGHIERKDPAAPGNHGMGRVTANNMGATTASVRLEKADVVTVQETGPLNSRYNMVFVGDGYTAAQQDRFVEDVRRAWNDTVRLTPFSQYKAVFNVYAVKAISRDSGVSDDIRNINKDTALNSRSQCDGVDRGMCVDVEKAIAYAKNAPKVDQAIVLANTSTYGGSGYMGYNLAVCAANAEGAMDIPIHELGHSMAGMLDEYAYGNETWTDPDPVNVSNLTTYKDGRKWSHLMGKSTPDGGTIGTYEGGGDSYARGIYRPSQDSMMRNLGRPFNLVGVETFEKLFKSKAPDVKPGDPVTGPKPTAGPTTKPTTPPTSKPTSTPTVRPTEAPGGSAFYDNANVAIRDYSTVTRRLDSSFANGKKLTLTLDIEHACRQNLDIVVVTPDGARNVLARSSSSRGGCQPFGGKKSETYDMRSKTEGAWTLEIRDSYSGNEGTLKGWGISFS